MKTFFPIWLKKKNFKQAGVAFDKNWRKEEYEISFKKNNLFI